MSRVVVGLIGFLWVSFVVAAPEGPEHSLHKFACAAARAGISMSAHDSAFLAEASHDAVLLKQKDWDEVRKMGLVPAVEEKVKSYFDRKPRADLHIVQSLEGEEAVRIALTEAEQHLGVMWASEQQSGQLMAHSRASMWEGIRHVFRTYVWQHKLGIGAMAVGAVGYIATTYVGNPKNAATVVTGNVFAGAAMLGAVWVNLKAIFVSGPSNEKMVRAQNKKFWAMVDRQRATHMHMAERYNATDNILQIIRQDIGAIDQEFHVILETDDKTAFLAYGRRADGVPYVVHSGYYFL